METKKIVTILNEIANQSQDWFAISQKLKEMIQSPESDLIPYLYAFQYMMVKKQNFEYYDQFGPLAPIITFANGRTSPPPLNTICDDTLRKWEKILLKTSNSLICSRLSDLLWLRKWKDKESYKFAQTAIDDYCSLSEGSLIDTQVPEALERALDLSCQINDKSRKNKVINEIISIWNQSLEENNHPPKMSFSLLNLLMSLPKDEIPIITNTFINDLLKIYDENSHMIEILLTHKIQLAEDDKEKDNLIENRIRIWIEESDKAKENVLIKHAYCQGPIFRTIVK